MFGGSTHEFGALEVEALGDVLAGYGFSTFEFEDEFIENQDVGEVVSDGGSLVEDFNLDLRHGGDTTEAEFVEECTFVHLFQKAGAKGVGHFEGGVIT